MTYDPTNRALRGGHFVVDRAGARLLIGVWEDTPKWMFWKPSKRRLRLPMGSRPHLSLYEYQHPAYVAREFLEKSFCPTENPENASVKSPR